MADKRFNLNPEAKGQELDLTLGLGNNKGKRLADGPSEPEKRKRTQKDFEDVSTGQSSKEKLALLERRIEEMEKLVSRRIDELTAKIDKHFWVASLNLYNQQEGTIDFMRRIHTSLQQITQSLAPRTLGELQRYMPQSGAPSSSRPEPPSSSKPGPQSTSATKQPPHG